MEFKVKDMDVATGGIKVAVVNINDAKRLDLKHEDRILLKNGLRQAVCIVDIGESKKAVPSGWLGLFEESLDELRAKQGTRVSLHFEQKPKSLSFVRKKLDGKKLSRDEIYKIVSDIVAGRLSSIELTYFVSAGYTRGLDIEETAHLTNAMVDTGEVLKLSPKFSSMHVFDKHCIGGVAGNRTTMLVVPIVCAAGLVMPKTSSRSITSPAGTADTMEVLANVNLPLNKVREVVEKTNGCIVWGGALALAPADDMIIKVENPLSVDAEGQMLASILAKKKSVSSTDVLIDIPVGKGAKVETSEEAKKLSNDFQRVGSRIGLRVKTIFSHGSEPIGNGIGPVLEARDALLVLKNDALAPKDLRNKATMMAGIILEMGGKARPGKGQSLAAHLLETGAAYEKMIDIIKAQGANAASPEKLNRLIGKHSYDFVAKKNGIIAHMDNKKLSKICRIAGCPEDKGAGMLLHKHVHHKVLHGEKILTLYSESRQKLHFAKELLDKDSGIIID